ncbi:Holliday junction resolvase RuvX [bacterium]|nr:Holliday junction resolvase RuvX [bacterium]
MPDGADAIPSGTVLAFDFGLKRIGVAIGEMMLGQARPLATIAQEANDARFAAIGRLIEEWQPATLIVGLPLTVDGEEHEMSARCRRFAHQLEGRYRLPVRLVDERFSSVTAEERLAGRGLDWRQRKQAVDAEAATVILQDWFDHAH